MKILPNSTLLLLNKKGKKYLLNIQKNEQFHSKEGILDLKELIGKEFGTKIYSHLDKEFTVLPPCFMDYLKKIKRSPQIIHPKDAAQMILELDICSGKKVLEIATGSGCLTSILANFVKPSGKVFSYEINSEFSNIAKENLERMGLSKYVEFKTKDVKEGIDETDTDCAVLDFPYPHEILDQVRAAIKIGAKVAIYQPNAPQVNRIDHLLKQLGFVDIKTFDITKKEYDVSKDVFRPKGKILAHTAYITIARRAN